MESLRSILILNQGHLAKLRVRLGYCNAAIKEVEVDFHKQYGPFAEYWDEWQLEAEEMRQDLYNNILVADEFVQELNHFVGTLENKKRLTKSDRAHATKVSDLAKSKSTELKELLVVMNERIAMHRELTKRLHMVDVLDSLGDD